MSLAEHSTSARAPAFSSIVLQLRLWVQRRGAVAACSAALCVAGSGAWLWHITQLRQQHVHQQRQQSQRQNEEQMTVASISPGLPLAVHTAPTDQQNLALFYDALGERRYTEQQLKTVFGLAAENGLSLAKGQYKSGYEQQAQLYTYQMILPVKGSYRAVWQFATQTLAAIPFASLDEISFKRDSIADNQPEAHLRFTLYLSDRKNGNLSDQMSEPINASTQKAHP